jgi:PAS domain S-box-containing protein
MSHILIIDDDPMARELLVSVLGYAGHTTSEASDGAEGLEKIRLGPPDLIVVDLLMPTMDGFEFVRRLREMPEFASMPVVFYSATYLESEARRLAKLCGVQHIITKPSEPREILKTIGAVLGAAPPAVAPLPLEEFHREHIGLLATKLSQKAAEAVPRLDAMIDLSLQFASERDPATLLELFSSASREIIGARYSIVAVWENSQQEARFLFTSGMSRGLIAGVGFPRAGGGVLGDVLSERRAYRLNHLSGDVRSVGLPSAHPPIQSLLCVPIASPEHTYGYLCLSDKLGGADFSEEDEGLAQILAAQVGRIYENSSLYSEVRRRAEALEREMAERQRAQDALRQSEERFSKAFSANPAAISIHRVDDTRLIDVNERFCDFFGYQREEIIGRTSAELNLWADADERGQLLQTVKEVGYIRNVEVVLRRKSGEYRTALISIETIELSGKPHNIAMLIDLTEHKRLEEQLRQAQKMEAIGQLAGGVAHDFNNILTVILGNARLIETTDSLPAGVDESVRQIVQAAEQASGLTHQLLTFSRRRMIQPKNLDLNEVVGDMIKMLQRILGEDIKVQFEPGTALPAIHADAGMIEQILMNLAVNSRDAMPKGGQLSITTTRVAIDDTFAQHNPEAHAGNYVCLEMSDTGEGIEAENLTKIFEPFFTTKDVGKGTGLGLATVYGIVKQHRGWVNVASEVGRGTAFTMYFPAADGKAAASRKPEEQAVRGGTETILIVEDHPLLRSIVRKVLERYGYRVLDAKSGVDALQVWKESSGEIQLLLTDVIMPDGMTGRELAQQLIGERPNLKVIFTSGYSAEVMGQDFVLEEGVNFLMKPYDLRKLADAVRNCLDGAPFKAPHVNL